MVIKILKKAGATAPAPAPIVAPPPPPPPASKPSGGLVIKRKAPATVAEARPGPVPLTPEESLAYWKRQPPIGAKPRECAYCGQFYIVPCTEAQATVCANYLYAQEKAS